MKRPNKILGLRAFSIVEVMIAVSIVAILAALALPAMTSFIRASRTSEAIINIRKIYDGETAYFTSDQVNQAGGQLPPQFVECPATPPAPPGIQKTLGDWDQPEWAAIQFAQDSPVFFSYSVETSGLGSDAEFTVHAEGDLDGDGVFSLFERLATVNDTTGNIEGSAGIYIVREIE